MADFSFTTFVIVACLAFVAIYLASNNAEKSFGHCPVEIQGDKYVWTDKRAIFPFATDNLFVGPDLNIKVVQDVPLKYTMFNKTQPLFSIFNNSQLLGPSQPRRCEEGRLYISGMKVPESERVSSTDYVSLNSRLDFVAENGDVITRYEVTSLIDGSSGYREVNLNNPSQMMTAFINRNPPQYIFGKVSPSVVATSAQDMFVLQSGPINQNAVPCATVYNQPGTTSITFTFTPVPSTCDYFIKRYSYNKRISMDLNAGQECVQYAGISNAVVLSSAISASIASVANQTVDATVCFTAGACSVANLNSNKTISATYVSTQITDTVQVKLGCTGDRLKITCYMD